LIEYARDKLGEFFIFTIAINGKGVGGPMRGLLRKDVSSFPCEQLASTIALGFKTACLLTTIYVAKH
jgi:hypothetical protein